MPLLSRRLQTSHHAAWAGWGVYDARVRVSGAAAASACRACCIRVPRILSIPFRRLPGDLLRPASKRFRRPVTFA